MYRFDGEILSTLDVLMTDIKVFDNGTHTKYTGIPNTEILENIKKADEMGIPMIVRTPIVVGVNDNEDNIVATAHFLRCLKNVVRYELLPYHPLGASKARALGIEYKTFETPSARRMEELERYADLRR
jgi:pyruvate formate lyase activating enzyme